MILEGCLGEILRDTLLEHKDHNVTIAIYGPEDDPVDVCLECEDCNVTLISTAGTENETPN